jgi:hypothetical protein
MRFDSDINLCLSQICSVPRKSTACDVDRCLMILPCLFSRHFPLCILLQLSPVATTDIFSLTWCYPDITWLDSPYLNPLALVHAKLCFRSVLFQNFEQTSHCRVPMPEQGGSPHSHDLYRYSWFNTIQAQSQSGIWQI